MTEQFRHCVIWPDFPATSHFLGDGGLVDYVTSERAGGTYAIEAQLLTDIRHLDSRVKARLTTWLVDEQRDGKEWPRITDEAIRYAELRQSLSVEDRLDRLLEYLVEQSDSLGKNLEVSLTTLLARTESTESEEVEQLVITLHRRSLIGAWGFRGPETLVTSVTVDGHSHIERAKEAAVGSSQVFVAMWFDESMKAAYEEGMEPAIRETGYRPFRVDQKQHLNKIDDEIIGEIRHSKFLVADFTQDGDKARGSVYYEAGFARGCGLEVIFTCHEDSLDKLHFDTRQYKHIVWTTPEELREQLRNGILANFGEGPDLDKSA